MELPLAIGTLYFAAVFVWNDLSHIFAWISTRKNKGISYGSPVLIAGEGKKVYTFGRYKPQMWWHFWCYVAMLGASWVPHLQDPRPLKLQPWSFQVGELLAEDIGRDKSTLPDLDWSLRRTVDTEPETVCSPSLHLRGPDTASLKFVPGMKWWWTASFRYRKSSEPPGCVFLLPVRSETHGMTSYSILASAEAIVVPPLKATGSSLWGPVFSTC